MNLDKENFANPSPDDLLSPKVISDRMNRLVGKALWRCTRAADLVAFQFGERRETRNAFGTPALVGEYALHVQCAWRITRDDQVLVGNVDLYYPARSAPESDLNRFDWDHMANRRDELIRELFIGERTEFPIIRVDVGQAYNLRIITESICLEIFPNDTTSEEYWRFFRPNTEEEHLVARSARQDRG